MSNSDLLKMQHEGTKVDRILPRRSASTSALQNNRQIPKRGSLKRSSSRSSSYRRSDSSELKSSRSPPSRRDGLKRTTSSSSRQKRRGSKRTSSLSSSSRSHGSSKDLPKGSSSEKSRVERPRSRSSHRSSSRNHNSKRVPDDRRNSADGASRSDYKKRKSDRPLPRRAKSSNAKLGGGSLQRRSGSSEKKSRNGNRADGASRPDGRKRRSDSLSVSSRSSPAELGSGTSQRRSGRRGRHSKNEPIRTNSTDELLSIGSMGVLSEDDEEKHLYSDEDESFDGKDRASKKKSHRKKGVAIKSTLYGDDKDAKSKAKASARDSGELDRMPGVQQVSTRTTSTLYGSDADAKSKTKRGHASVPGVEQVISTSAQGKATISTLYGTDSDVKVKSKRQMFSSSSVNSKSSSAAVSTLYGKDADAKAKTKGKASSNPGFSSVRTVSTNETLYGNDTDAKAKARSTKGRSAVPANPGMESFMATNLSDKSDRRDPVANRVSIESTDTDSGSNPDSQHKNTQKQRKKRRKGNDNEEPKKSRKKRIALFMLFLLLIGGGVAAWFFLFKNKRKNQDSQISPPNFQDPTTAPSFSTTVSSAPPTSIVTWSPFLEGLLYQPPTEDNCRAIARNETIAGRESMEDADFGLGLDVVLSGKSTMTPSLVYELLNAIQEKILPSLAGCNIVLDEFVEDWRFVIFDAFVSGNVQPDERCIDDNLATQNCHFMSVKLDLFLKGRVRFLDIIHLISDEEVNISNHLGLSDPFSIVKLVQIDNLTPTASPTRMPSDAPNWTPSESPTGQDATNPVSLPTATPTRRGPGVPTRSPSLVATLTPSVVSVTALPVANPSPATTHLPTASPSTRPIETPSAVPSFRPSKTPNAAPTVSPLARPSYTPNVTPTTKSPLTLPTLRPSNLPSKRPSTVPSGSPSTTPSGSPSTTPSAVPSTTPSAVPTSPAPSSAPSSRPSSSPSSSPSVSPSKSPSATPSVQPSDSSYYWVTCGGKISSCAEIPATVQNANYRTVDGNPATDRVEEIATRCCSQDAIPGWSEPKSESCPYTESKIGGMCYNTTSYHEADSICSGAGARLCTLKEVQDGCTASSGCQHNHRMVWTSDPAP